LAVLARNLIDDLGQREGLAGILEEFVELPLSFEVCPAVAVVGEVELG
jgi:hypothetical protein